MTASWRSPALPAAPDLRFRPYAGPSDHQAMAGLDSEIERSNGIAERTTVAIVDHWLARPKNMDPFHDMALVEDATGRIVAQANVRWRDRATTGERSYELACSVHPDVRRRGIGTALLGWQTERIAEIRAATVGEGARKPAIATGYIPGRDVGGQRLLEGAGYRAVRREAELVRPDLLEIGPAIPPEGITIRAGQPLDEELVRRAWRLGGEVFSQHWGDSVPDFSEAAWARFRDHPEIQPDLWCLAFDGDELVGHILNYLAHDDDGSIVGWTEGIAVRDGWRRRGVARAMLARSLEVVRDAGATTAALGVDLGNPNQAVDLYESLGFRIIAEEIEYHRPLD